LADYLYLWETAVVKRAFEMALASAWFGGDPSSYMCQQDSVFAAQKNMGVPMLRPQRLLGQALRICKSFELVYADESVGGWCGRFWADGFKEHIMPEASARILMLRAAAREQMPLKHNAMPKPQRIPPGDPVIGRYLSMASFIVAGLALALGAETEWGATAFCGPPGRRAPADRKKPVRGLWSSRDRACAARHEERDRTHS